METASPQVAAVYLRCSKDRNDEASVDEQNEVGLERCRAEGWEPRAYKDNDRSASRYARKGRDDWLRLVADLRAGAFTIVWLWESSRGDRKLYEWAGFLEDCRERGVRIYVETHGRLYDIGGNHRDWKTLAEDGVNNAYASDEISLRVKRDLARNARKGRPHGPVGYGIRRVYDTASGKPRYVRQEPHPETGPVAAEIITRIAAGENIMAIKASLEARGIPGAGGNGWDRQTIRQIGLNPAYAGLRRTDSGWIEAWEPLVPAEVHHAAVAVLRSRAGQRTSRQKHLLSYLARCECGATLAAYVRLGALMYKCRAHGCVNVAAAWLDELVTLVALDALAAPEFAGLYTADGSEAAALRQEAAELQRQLDEWATADISPRAYAIKEAQLRPQIERLGRDADAASAPPVLRELLGAEDARPVWEALTVASRRDVIRALMDVTVTRAPDQTRAARTDPGRVIINWKKG